MNTSHVRREGEAVGKKVEAKQGETPITTDGSEKQPIDKRDDAIARIENRLSSIEVCFGTSMVIFEGDYDIPELYLEDPTVLDIGANQGAASVWAMYRFPGCKIHAYEPCRATFSGLKELLGKTAQVVLHNAAVTEAEKPFLRYGVNSNQENSIHDLGTQRPDGEVVDTIKPFDLPKADFVKIDTEGCEVEILQAYLNKHQPRGIALEWHSLADRLTLGKLLRARGYLVTERPNVPANINKNVYIGIMKGFKP